MVVLPNSDARLRARFYSQLYSTGPNDGDSRQTEESKELCQRSAEDDGAQAYLLLVDDAR
jgi:hypothetical protein